MSTFVASGTFVCCSMRMEASDVQARPATADSRRRETSIPTYTVNHADRLSRNRALRNAAVGLQAHEHINNVYHMHRRIEDQCTIVERRKNAWDPAVHPVSKQHSQKSSIARSLCSWLPQQPTRCSPLMLCPVCTCSLSLIHI